MNRILLKRFAEAEDIAPSFVFFASDESSILPANCSVWMGDMDDLI